MKVVQTIQAVATGEDLLGRLLAGAITAEGRRLGYEHMRLDALPSMKSAQQLHAALGFKGIPAYGHNLIPDTMFPELSL